MMRKTVNESPESSFMKRKNESRQIIDEEVHSSAESSPDSPTDT